MGLPRWILTALLGIVSRHRELTLAMLSVIGSFALSRLAQRPAGPHELLTIVIAASSIFLIVLVGLIDRRYSRARLIALMLPAIHRVLDLQRNDRLALQVIHSVRTKTYEQLTDYYWPDNPHHHSRGNVYPLSHGSVGQAFHNKLPVPWSIPLGKTFDDAMTERWSFSDPERMSLRHDRRSFLAYPIGREGPYAKAVLFIDSDDPQRLGEHAGGPEAIRRLNAYFEASLAEAMRDI